MVPPPKIEPGDMLFCHCDLIHLVDPIHTGQSDTSVFYIPSSPLCDRNVKYAFCRREAFLKGFTGPDFLGFPYGTSEPKHKDRGTSLDVEEYGGKNALQEFTLEKFGEKVEFSTGAKKAIRK